MTTIGENKIHVPNHQSVNHIIPRKNMKSYIHIHINHIILYPHDIPMKPAAKTAESARRQRPAVDSVDAMGRNITRRSEPSEAPGRTKQSNNQRFHDISASKYVQNI
jgi:hypothetical protein